MKHTIQTTLAALEAQGIPRPEPEYRFFPPRRWRLDHAWPELLLAWEIEGAVWTGGRHTRGKGYSADCAKYSQAAILGWRVIRTTTQQVESGLALEWLLSAAGVRL